MCDSQGMELRQLECFVAVAEESNFTRAAARLHVVQSAVSATIAALERDLHTQLLQRSSRKVQLTEAGSALLPKARATLAAAREARDAVDDITGGIRGVLRVGTLTSLGLIDLPALLGQFHREHPAVTVNVVTAASHGGSVGLTEAVAEGRLDIAFVSIPGRSPVGVRLTHLAIVSLYLVVPVGHALAGRREVTLSDLAGESFIDFPTSYGNRAVTDRAFAAAGLQRHVAIEINNVKTGPDFIRHGLGVALLPPEIFAAEPHDDLVTVPISGADLQWPISLATPSGRSPSAAARAFEQIVVQQLPGTEPASDQT
jgi:DNA-binding transcriptional LysR family regulator